MKELMELANSVAKRMWNDPEAESAAGFALLLALRKYDPAKNVPLRAYVVRRVKLAVMYYKRSKANRRDTLIAPELWDEVYDRGGYAAVPPCAQNLVERLDDRTPRTYRLDEEPADPPISVQEWQLLTESYVDRIALDVIARRRNTTVYAVKKVLKAARAKLAKWAASVEREHTN